MNTDKWLSVFKGAVIALMGGGIAAVLQYLQTVDWGTLGPIAGAVIAIGINFVRKWFEKEKEVPTAIPAPVGDTFPDDKDETIPPGAMA